MRNATEIRKNFFGDSSDSEEVKSWKWNRGQAWSLIKGLAKNDEVRFSPPPLSFVNRLLTTIDLF